MENGERWFSIDWFSLWPLHQGMLTLVSLDLLQQTGNWVRSTPSIPFLGIYSDKTMIQKDTCSPKFIAVLFTMTKTWKQPKYPTTDEWIKKMWFYIYIYIHICVCVYIYMHTHTIEYYSATRKNGIMPWMDLEIIIPNEVSQTEKDKYYMISLTYGI